MSTLSTRPVATVKPGWKQGRFTPPLKHEGNGYAPRDR